MTVGDLGAALPRPKRDWLPALTPLIVAAIAAPFIGSASSFVTLTAAGLAMGMMIFTMASGLTLAFGETNGGFRRLIQIVFGLSIAFAASSFFLTFFQFGGGALV